MKSSRSLLFDVNCILVIDAWIKCGEMVAGKVDEHATHRGLGDESAE